MRYTTQFADGTGINLTKHMRAVNARNTVAPPEWIQHSPYHWARELNGKRLDFWPTKDKWMYDGKTYRGDVDDFINQANALNT